MQTTVISLTYFAICPTSLWPDVSALLLTWAARCVSRLYEVKGLMAPDRGCSGAGGRGDKAVPAMGLIRQQLCDRSKIRDAPDDRDY